MKTYILVGGLGTRLGMLTKTTPKPLVTIGNHPILWHILKNMVNQSLTDFYLCSRTSNVSKFESFVRDTLRDNSLETPNTAAKVSIQVLDTGEERSTADRIYSALTKTAENGEICLVTYGDSLLDININKLTNEFAKGDYPVIVTAVPPPVSYGYLMTSNNRVTSFGEKKMPDGVYISGGYFLLSLGSISRYYKEEEDFEKSVLPQLAKLGELGSYVHEGFWHPMDTASDRANLERLIEKGETPWLGPIKHL